MSITITLSAIAGIMAGFLAVSLLAAPTHIEPRHAAIVMHGFEGENE